MKRLITLCLLGGCFLSAPAQNYVSEAYMQYKTNDVLVHKNAIPKDIRKKLGIK